MEEQIKQIKTIANNALYFDDNSDYCSALWEILRVSAPEMFSENKYPCLEYMDDNSPLWADGR